MSSGERDACRELFDEFFRSALRLMAEELRCWCLPVIAESCRACGQEVLRLGLSQARVRLGRSFAWHAFEHVAERATRDELNHLLPDLPVSLRPLAIDRFVTAVLSHALELIRT